MSYQVIARKWRPQKFEDMVGQEHIARTLKNAIMSGRIAHAYLFVGPRGIGKTTTARIFAKALNCTNPQNGEPCCKCSSCKAIANETSVDVIEIDAATHTQVEKARELCEDVLHLPISSKYKIYIIDEVHMLSKSAWNALLKTIEEPPAHAKFIFATTEVNKVLPTVISRCQRFDLRRIKSSDIAKRLRLIADTEKVNVSDSAINVIAQAADGGMRDAQSLLDQLISFFGEDGSAISEEQALSLFGLTAPAEMENLMRAITGNDRAATIVSIHNFAEQGKNLETLYEEIISWLRGILMCRILRDPSAVIEDTPEKIAIYSSIAASCDPGAIQRLIESLSSSGYQLRDAVNKQVFMESILLKAMRFAHAVQVEALIARLNQIRQTGELAPASSVVPIYEVPVGNIVAASASVYAKNKIEPMTVQIPAVKAPAPAEAPAPEKKTPDAPAGSVKVQTPPNPAPAPMPAPTPAKAVEDDAPQANVVEEEAKSFVEDVVSPDDIAPEFRKAPMQAEEQKPSVQAQEAKSVPQAQTEKAARLSEMESDPTVLWDKLIMDVRDVLHKEMLSGMMEDADPEKVSGSLLTVAFDSDYEALQCTMTEKDLPLIERRLRDITGDPDATIMILRKTGIASQVQRQEKISVEQMKAEEASNPAVRAAIDLFGGRISDVHEAEKKSGNSE